MPIHLPPLSRRQFLTGALATSAGLMLSSRLAAAAGRPVDENAWALLSDSHVAADRAKMARGINMAGQLAAVIADVLDQPRRPAAAFINGDLAFNSGEAADYTTFVDLIAPLRAAGVPLHLALGNHDHRERFWSAVREDAAARRPVVDRHVALVRAARANWLMLDSLDKTNSTPGLFGAEQVRWLAKTLDQNPRRPAIVVAHHNPSLSAEKVNIIDEAALFEVLRPRRQVKAFIFGHSHRWNVAQDTSGIHLINLPPTGYVFEPARPAGWVLARLESKGMRLQLRCLDTARPDHGQTVELAWRS